MIMTDDFRPPNNNCDECWFLTEANEERTYCPECVADIREATELVAEFKAIIREATELVAELKAMEG